MKTLMGIVLTALVLSACASTRQTVVAPAPRAPIIAPQAAPVNMLPVEWRVLNKAELERILLELTETPDPKFALMALTPQGFENLALNMEDLKRFMREQNQVIFYFKQATAE